MTVKPKELSTLGQNSSPEYTTGVENTEDDLSTFVSNSVEKSTEEKKIDSEFSYTSEFKTTTDFTSAVETSSNVSGSQDSRQ